MDHTDNPSGTEISSEMLRNVREQALLIVNATLKESRAQHPLDVPEIFNYDRPTLSGTVPIELYRAVRLLAFREVVGSKMSAAVLTVSGKSVARKMGVGGISQLIHALQELCLAKATIEKQTDNRIIISAVECATCSGIPYVGEPICSFESGFIAGSLIDEMGEQIKVVETHCWGLGDRICRWEVRRTTKSDSPDESDTLNVIMELASNAAHAMENGIAVRTKNRELRQAYDQLRESERMKKDLTDMIVHDMRIPMNNVMGSIDMLAELMDSRLTAKESRLMEMALSGGRQLVSMTDDLLDISRLEAGKSPIKKSRTSLTEIVAQAMDLVGPMGKRKGIDLSVNLCPSIPEMNVDSSRIVRVLVNLLGNAVQYTPSGGCICVSARLRPEDGKALISVSDTGEGIPRELHSRIFDKFVQVESPKSRRRASTGLGLTFCKLVTEAHGGSIWVESEPGLGSVFYFALPVD